MSGEHPGSHGDGTRGEGGPPDGVPDFTGPGAPEPEFLPCYRHPDRQTGITCQRCRRPICMQCMHGASVGFQCPDCSGAGQQQQRRVRPPVTSGRMAQRLNFRASPVTWALVGLCLLIGLVDLVTRGLANGFLALSSASIDAGQWWRLVTFAVTSAGLFSLAINALVMVLIGRSLETVLGGWRLAAVYLTGCLVGGALFVVVSPGSPFGITGMSAGTIGLIAASAAMKLRMGQDVRMDLVLLGLLVVLSFVAGFGSHYWVSQLGGVLGGGGAALIMAFAPRQRGATVQVAGLIAVWVISVVAVGLSSALV